MSVSPGPVNSWRAGTVSHSLVLLPFYSFSSVLRTYPEPGLFLDSWGTSGNTHKDLASWSLISSQRRWVPCWEVIQDPVFAQSRSTDLAWQGAGLAMAQSVPDSPEPVAPSLRCSPGATHHCYSYSYKGCPSGGPQTCPRGLCLSPAIFCTEQASRSHGGEEPSLGSSTFTSLGNTRELTPRGQTSTNER